MRFFDDERFLCKGLFIVIIAGIIIRLVLGYYVTFVNDITAWVFTITNIDGGNGLYGVAGYYYPPVWGYYLAVFAEIIEHLGVDSLGDFFTEVLFMEEMEEEGSITTPTFNLVFTIFLTILDLLASLMIYWIVDYFTDDKVKAKMGFALFFLGINVIAVSSMGAMFDSFSALMTLLCFCMLIKKYDFLAGVMFAMAVLLKLFPVFLIFLLVCYILKDKDNWKPRLLKAVLGAGIATAIIMLPVILNGTLLDSVSFLTDRAGGSEESTGFISKYHDVLVYSFIFILSIVAAVVFMRQKTDAENLDRQFLWFMVIAVIIIFQNTGAPQYLILLMPFLIIGALMFDRRMYIPLAILMIGCTIAQVLHLGSEMVSVTMYDHLISFDSFVSLYDAFYGNGNFVYNLLMVIGNGLEELAVLIAAVIVLDHFGINYGYLKRLVSEHRDKDNSALTDSD